MPLWQSNVSPGHTPFEQSYGPPVHTAPTGNEGTHVLVVESHSPLPHGDADVHAAPLGAHATQAPVEPQ